jgi:hypothetical protein
VRRSTPLDRYERYEDTPRGNNLITGYTPPAIRLLGIFPAFAVLKIIDYAGFSSIVQVGGGIVAYIIATSGLAVFVRNKLRKNPQSKWRYLQQLY